jgi:hypothetical protein
MIDGDRSGISSFEDYEQYEKILAKADLGFNVAVFLRTHRPSSQLFEEKAIHINTLEVTRRIIYLRMEVIRSAKERGDEQILQSKEMCPLWFDVVPKSYLPCCQGEVHPGSKVGV